MIRDVLDRLRYLVRRSRADEDLREEMETHRSLRQAQLEREGFSVKDALAASRRALGNVALAREDARDVWIVRWMETLRQDLRNGVRMLGKHPGVTTAAILSLAIGIGANTAVFSVLNRILLQPLAYQEPDRLVMISAVPSERPEQRSSATIPEYIAWERFAKSFDGLTTAFQQPQALRADDNGSSAEIVLVEKVRSSVFSVLGVRPAVGRAFRPDEEQVDAPAPVVLLSDDFWATRYNRDPGAVGRVIRLGGTPKTIIGVMPPGFSFLPNGKPQLYEPLSWNTPQLRGTARVFPVVARLKPGVTLAQAQSEMDTVVTQAATELPAQSRGWRVRVGPLQDAVVGDLRPVLVLLQGVVGFVLLIACANVAGLLLVRATARRTEIAVRAAIGAGRGRIVRQLLSESVVLATAGGLAGLVVGWVLIRTLVPLSGSFLPTVPDIHIDAYVLTLTLVTSILTGIAVGVMPAVGASRPDLVDALKASGKGTVAVFDRQRVRRTIVIAQVTLSFVLLIGAGLTIRSLVRLETRDLGGDPTGVLKVQIPFTGTFRQIGSAAGYPVAEAIADVPGAVDRILERLRSLPGAVSVAGASFPPFASSGPVTGFDVEGRVVPAGETTDSVLNATYQIVTPEFFATMRIPMERGREFDSRDTGGGPWGLVINAAMARQYWPNENPLGQRVLIDMTADEQPREIIGVVGNYRSSPYELEPKPAMFALYSQQPARTRSPAGVIMRNQMNFVVRASADPAALAVPVRATLAEIDPGRPISDLQPVEHYLDAVLAPSRYAMVIFSLFAGLALLLAAVGTYGVMSHGVGQRTREIGIRMTLGARPLDVLRLVMGEVLLIAGVGVALGLTAALALTRLMPNLIAGLIWGIQPTDLFTYAAVSAVLALVAGLAAWIPARRAIRIAPTVALRCE